ncbi:hypothetical protein [Tardiphaga sp.]|uniref:hypothetical protein n=1 Tax=Tardiphaga sp. TaxID=1926292 RepID=UPI002627DB9B|nr:hypothetical protein [Tardiphaga sp.]MDB5620246.1 hypothetical protein [Tardiphaga sp.]
MAAAAAPDHAYAYKASLVGAAHLYELAADGLSWRTGRKAGLWRYRDIAEVRLSYRPMGMQAKRFRCDLRHEDGSRIVIMSTSKQTVALMQPQAGYRGFILELHRQMEAAGSDASLHGGLRPGLYWTIVAALVLVGVAMVALLVRALVTGEFAGVAFIIGFAVFATWQLRGVLRRNRPRDYTFADVPADLLP